MPKPKPGDIYEIATSKGVGYLQCIHTEKLRGEIIRVFNKLWSEMPPDLDAVTAVTETYFVGFPLAYSCNKKITILVGHVALPAGLTKPRYMRSKINVRGEDLGWHIVDTETLHRTLVKELNEAQREMSIFGMVNDTMLIEWLEKGWMPRDWV